MELRGISRTGVMSSDQVNRVGATGVKKTSFASKLGNFAKGVAKVGIGVAGSVVPGGSVIANAISGALGGGGLLTGGGGSSAAVGASGDNMMRDMMAMNVKFMQLQQSVQLQSQSFQTTSNASRAAHDVALNSIRNMKA